MDAPVAGALPIELSAEIDRAREWLETLPPAQRQACELMMAARMMSWAQDLERLSRQFSRAA